MTLSDIVTPLRLLELFVDDVLVNIIFGNTKLNSHKEKAGISLEITNKKICLFLSMPLLSRWHGLTDRKMYWETSLDTFVLAKSDSVPCNRFERILRDLYLCDNEQLDN